MKRKKSNVNWRSRQPDIPQNCHLILTSVSPTLVGDVSIKPLVPAYKQPLAFGIRNLFFSVVIGLDATAVY